ncbi:MAG: sn-glycerol-3-phosphate ABC transporter ATP-binding protein UgpC [Nitrospinota bacterium]|nr:glycerol-3-phosphate ABC transporter ATP-binding protein [Nitrospinota bacterium]MDP6366976.1 sn-glycerol-3-phosphate ABC transporter ATP-binding protein UgpC [Nitrospinota bacterium]MDP7168489.1 sn-glycerol-3-phosphate ABC transporter ATP-binding protein UgpC [Nitrospinota bacterium]MDP7504021.1 sn-glycerol-3-phosphate ABC transporter ATP-binding protein UgpC [Nitrospinota bacterium]
MGELVLEKLGKNFGNVVAVKDVDLTVHDQEFVVLLGPSGCGKSTTLRLIAGLEEVTAGDIFMDGRRLNDVLPRDRDIAMVFQNYALYPHKTVFANMGFALKLRRVPKDQIVKRVKEVANILGIDDLMERFPKELSGGQRQRVALGRAIVRNPRAFLFDEPLSNLDAMLRVQMRVELLKLHNQLNATSVYVTHDQIEAMTMGDRIVVMLDAVIQQVGTPMEVYKKPINQFVAGFIGSPSMNFAPAKVGSADGKLSLEGQGFKAFVSSGCANGLGSYVGRDVTFGVRPEDLELGGDAGMDNTFEAKIELVEPVGSDIFLELDVSGTPLTARVNANLSFSEGEKITFTVNPNRVHAFDVDTGIAIL